MSWQEKDKMTLRKEFISQAIKEDVNMAQLCRRYGISRKTGYKWLSRFKEGKGLEDKSKRPAKSPHQLPIECTKKIIQIREKYPYWGARKIHAILAREHQRVPAKSVIHKILKKHGYIQPCDATNSHYQRFEHKEPNHLWQMDFKGHFAFEKGRCFPLTILDDHSRFSILLSACENEKGETVKPLLIKAFRLYGLPMRINVDNGNPWGSLFEFARYTTLSVWLIRLGVSVSYSRPYHPQTNGKEERFHRTLKLELLRANYFKDIEQIQRKFDKWRAVYNQERPHEGINMQVPAARYRPSYRNYPESLLPIEYAKDYLIKKVDSRGRIFIQGRQIFVGMPFSKEPLGIRYQATKDVIDIYYCHQKLGEFDLAATAKNTITNLYSKRVTNL